ncbi:MAG TPA: ABC transporter substrate-binding protein, partial [Thermomicrobiales bacterium]|nr:ABC transporter substrate-binding protein [Thermomicrobiales bacterium]
MQRRLRSLAVLVVLLCLSPLAARESVMASPTGAMPHVLRVNWGPGVPNLDPQFSHEGQWSISGGLDWEGLTRIDEELRVVPGAAESWEFSPDGKTLTFHLRDGLVYSDGVPATAADFVYAAERLCSPEVNTASSDLLFDVIGCKDLFNSGGDAAAEAAAKAKFGVHALDEGTLQYQFTRPAPYFIVQASNWSAIPLRKELVEAGGPKWWTNPAARIGNGPFRLAEYTDDGANSRLRYVRNEHYWG